MSYGQYLGIPKFSEKLLEKFSDSKALKLDNLDIPTSRLGVKRIIYDIAWGGKTFTVAPDQNAYETSITSYDRNNNGGATINLTSAHGIIDSTKSFIEIFYEPAYMQGSGGIPAPRAVFTVNSLSVMGFLGPGSQIRFYSSYRAISGPINTPVVTSRIFYRIIEFN
jgi:hypothetical protein